MTWKQDSYYVISLTQDTEIPGYNIAEVQEYQ